MKIFHTKQTNEKKNPFTLQNEEKTKCSIEEFAVYFLNFVRNQTEE